MANEKLLTVRDVAIFLGISEKEVIDLAEKGALPAYKIADVYLRFKREQIEEFKKSMQFLTQTTHTSPQYSLKEKISDFLYFNDFYILSSILIILILVVIFRG